MISFRACDCGCVDEEEAPELYEEGIARVYYKDLSDERPLVSFGESDGYVVECPHCGAITKHYARKEMAVEAWNKHDLYYIGSN